MNKQVEKIAIYKQPLQNGLKPKTNVPKSEEE